MLSPTNIAVYQCYIGNVSGYSYNMSHQSRQLERRGSGTQNSASQFTCLSLRHACSWSRNEIYFGWKWQCVECSRDLAFAIDNVNADVYTTHWLHANTLLFSVLCRSSFAVVLREIACETCLGGSCVWTDIRGDVLLYASCRWCSSQPSRQRGHATDASCQCNPMSAVHRVSVSWRHHRSRVGCRRDSPTATLRYWYTTLLTC